MRFMRFMRFMQSMRFMSSQPSPPAAPPTALGAVRAARLGGLVFALAVLAAACGEGCCCGDECAPEDPDAGPGPALAFAGLPSTIDCGDDLEPGRAGEQIDVEVVRSGDESGFAEVTVAVDGQEVTGSFDEEGRATLRVTLRADVPDGRNTLRARSSNGARTLEASGSIVDACVHPEPSCSFVSPTDGDTLSASPAPITVRCAGGDPNRSIEQNLLGAGSVVVTATPAGGGTATAVEIQLTGFAGTGPLFLPIATAAVLDLRLVDNGGVFPAPVTDSIAVNIDLGGLVLIHPNDEQPYDEDEDGDLNGIDVPLQGSAGPVAVVSFEVSCDDDDDPHTGEVRRAGSSTSGEVTITPNAAGGIDFAGVLPGLLGPDCELRLTLDDNTFVQAFTVDADAPRFSFALSPDSPDGTLLASDDESPGDDVLQVTATITARDVSRAGVPLTATVVVTDSAGAELLRQEGLAIADDASFDVAIAFPYSDAQLWTLAVFATDGVVSGPSFTTSRLIDTVAPTVVIDVPAEGELLLASSDVSEDPGFQAAFSATVTGVEEAATFEIVEDGAVIGACTVEGGVCRGELTLEDGEHAITLTVRDAAGNATTSALRSFRVDSTPPDVTVLTLEVLSVRRGEVAVRFVEPGFGGNDATSLQLIAAREPIDAESFDALAVSPSPGGGGVQANSIVGAGVPRTVIAGPLAFDAAWHFGLRVRDDIGNETLVTAFLPLEDFDTVRSTHVRAAGQVFGGSAYGSGDLDGDGAFELVIVAPGEGVPDGDGFTPGAVHILGGGGDLGVGGARALAAPAGTLFFGTSAAILDLDSDGRSDLVVTGYASDLAETLIFVYYGQDSTAFVGNQPDAVLTAAATPDLVHDLVQPVGDVSDDGIDDLLIASTTGLSDELVLLRGGATRLASGALASAPASSRIVVGTAGGGASLFLPTAVGAGLVDGDDIADLVVATDGAASVNQLWPIAGRASWPAELDLGAAATAIPCAGSSCGQTSLTAGDVDGDGRTDLVVPVGGANRLNVHLGGAAGLSSTVSFFYAVPELFQPIFGQGPFGVIGDVNGDGRADVAVPQRGASSRISLFFGQSPAVNRTNSDVDYALGFGALDSAAAAACGDFDAAGDGLDDLCFITSLDDGSAVLHR
jgi:hypothetical protein